MRAYIASHDFANYRASGLRLLFDELDEAVFTLLLRAASPAPRFHDLRRMMPAI